MTRRNVLVVNERVECPRCNADIHFVSRYDYPKTASDTDESGTDVRASSVAGWAIVAAAVLVIAVAFVASIFSGGAK